MGHFLSTFISKAIEIIITGEFKPFPLLGVNKILIRMCVTFPFKTDSHIFHYTFSMFIYNFRKQICAIPYQYVRDSSTGDISEIV